MYKQHFILCIGSKINIFLQEDPVKSGYYYNATTYVVDAVWALAHALNNCISTTNEECSGSVGNFISNFSVNNEVSDEVGTRKTL